MKHILLFVIILCSIIGCDDINNEESFAKEEGLTIGDLLELNPDYSEWTRLLKEADLFNALTVREEFTCFVPSNTAVQAYAEENGQTSIDFMEKGEIEYFLKYHVIGGREYDRLLFTNGRLGDTTMSGDYLMTGYDESDILINDRSKLDGAQQKASNGILHQIDKCLDPVTETLADLVTVNPRYSIFNELVKTTGADTAVMDLLRDQYGYKFYATLFVVPNEIYNASGIEGVDVLIAKYSPHRDDYTDKSNPLYKYAAYHLMQGISSFAELADFKVGPKVKNMGTFASGELITIQDKGGVLQFNYDPNNEEQVITFYNSAYNILARNGIVHEVNNIMEIYTPDAVTVKFEFTDAAHFPGFSGLDWYLRSGDAGQGKTELVTTEMMPYIRYASIPEGAARVLYECRATWRGAGKPDTWYFDNGDVLNASCGPVGWWEMDLPYIVKGTYKVKLKYHKASLSRGDYQMSINGKNVGAPIVFGHSGGWSCPVQDVGTIHFRETTNPTVRFSVIRPGIMEVDYIIFELID